jgi:hypothetical protein
MTSKLHALLCALLFGIAATPAHTAPAGSEGAAALKTKYESLGEALKTSPFQRPLVIESVEAGNTLKGDVYAIVEHPYTAVSTALTNPARWCEILMLHVNTKQCLGGSGGALQMRVGSKNSDTAEQAHPIAFSFGVAASTPEYFAVRLTAPTGPVGTRDYRIIVEATPLDEGKTFLHLTYSYAYGGLGKIAMQAYLSSSGADKIGFTRTASGGYIGGMRGVVERNAMRYYLAIDAYLATASLPASQRTDRRLRQFFAGTEQYRRQLYDDLNESQYVAMKQKELQLQQVAKAG